MLSSVITHSSFSKSRHDVDRSLCQKWELFFVEPEVKSQQTQYWLDILLSQQILAIIKHVVDDNIIYLSATQLMHTPAHAARNTIQQLLHKTLNFISHELCSQQARAEIN